MKTTKYDRNKIDTYLIYGYREREGKNRWYVGATRWQRRIARDKTHRAAKGGDQKYFYNFIRKAYREKKTFEQVLEYCQLDIVVGTAKQADAREVSHTFLRNALAPNGFVLRAGGYGGAMSEELKQRISQKNKKHWQCAEKRREHSNKKKKYWAYDENRREQAIRCSGWKQKEEIKKQIGETQRNFSPEKRAKKIAKQIATLAVNTKRNRENRRVAKMLTRLAEAKERLKSGYKPELTGPELVTNIVFKSPNPMSDLEVRRQMPNSRRRHTSIYLLRSAGYNDEGTKYVGHRKQMPQRLMLIHLPNGRREFKPNPEFVIT